MVFKDISGILLVKTMVAFYQQKILIKLTANETVLSYTVNMSKTFCPLESCALLRCDCTAGPLPTRIKLVNATLIMPVQTAPIERGFSVHSTVKNCLTSSLKNTTLHLLLCSC